MEQCNYLIDNKEQTPFFRRANHISFKPEDVVGGENSKRARHMLRGSAYQMLAVSQQLDNHLW